MIQIPWTGLELIFLVIIGIIYVCYKLTENTRSTSRERKPRRHSRSRTSSSQRSSSTYARPKPLDQPTALDPTSSPIGGSCLNCGAIIEEETSLQCPLCGIQRERCPICQRFVAGGQELLGCPNCRTRGHANEMRTWVKQKYKCPHCGERLRASSLKKS